MHSGSLGLRLIFKDKKAKRETGSTFGNQISEPINQKILRSFDNFVRFNAAGAYLHPAVSAGGKFDTDRLQIRLKAPTGFIIRV